MSVLLKKSDFDTISPKELVEQIEAKKKCKNKLPSWYTTEKIYYPNKLHVEQSSSELTASYKAKIIAGKKVVDTTGGMGVDSFYFSKRFEQVFYCEINEDLAKIAAYNFKILGANNVKVANSDGMDFLRDSNEVYDCIYIDPSRRSSDHRKVFLLSDCTPDITKHLQLLFDKSMYVLLKTSPLLDISSGLKQLKNVKAIHVVAVDNDVKELLWVLQSSPINEISIQTVNFKKGKKELYDFTRSEEKNTSLNYALPLNFLYEPNAAVLKAGAFKIVAKDHGVSKLNPHSHLYTSQNLVEFPGRRFKIEDVIDFNKKVLKNYSNTKANITVRNFPENVANIRKRYRIKEGGDRYLFFTTLANDTYKVLVCTKAQADLNTKPNTP